MCILLDGDLSEYSFLSKTIIYGWIATVSLFILNYFLLEFMFIGLFTCSCADRSLSRSVLSYPLIIGILSAVSILLGSVYGIFYGSFQFPDTKTHSSNKSIMLFSPRIFVIPLGVVLGALSAVMFYYIYASNNNNNNETGDISNQKKHKPTTHIMDEDLEGLSNVTLENAATILSHNNLALFSVDQRSGI
jgi:hypothetical protein